MTKYRLLNKIDSPSILKSLKVEELAELCQELREFIIEHLANNPGHLGASLGVIELTVALHYVFDTPNDKLVWDVGHQAYAHKILTGRRDKFHTNRQFGGLSGFPTPKESEYDSFGVGHSSTSISAALGFSIASKIKGEDKQAIAIIGDGAMTCGLAFEGLNNASSYDNDLLIVLNDNNMAIDPIRGGFSSFLGKVHTSETYNKVRYGIYKALKCANLIGESGRKKIIKFSNSIKSLNSPLENNIFEGLNIRYFGPTDGHNVMELVSVLKELKKHKGPKVFHIITKKGKGYKPAEKSATTWHAPGEFNPKTGERINNTGPNTPPLYQDVFGKTLVELAKANNTIVGITPAMPSGCSMNFLFKEMPKRAFDVGIAEGHAVTFSGGLAKEGLTPFCNVYSSFMQRAYDNVIHDIALQKLNVVLCLDRAGIVGSDGATHQGQFDLAYFNCIPNLTISSPINEIELRNLMFTAQLKDKGAFVIRYPRGRGNILDWQQEMKEIEVGTGVKLKDGSDIAVLSIGPIGNVVSDAISDLGTNSGRIAHFDMRFLKPIDTKILDSLSSYKQIITVEDGTIIGGLGSTVTDYLASKRVFIPITKLGLPDEFIQHGLPDELYKMLGLDKNSIKSLIEKLLI